VETGRCVRTFKGHKGDVNSVSFSPDGRYALSGSLDTTCKLWDVETGRCVRTFEGHKSRVNSVSFSPDGRYALSGSVDKTCKLWELEWDLELCDEVDWDEAARPYLECFLTLHTPYVEPLRRGGMPEWTEDDFQKLLEKLANARLGYIRPEGIRAKLREMARLYR
jgi:WD40 repeat protein